MEITRRRDWCPIAIVTVAALVVTVFPPTSCTVTVTVGEIVTPATVAVGWLSVGDLAGRAECHGEGGAHGGGQSGRGGCEGVADTHFVD